MRGSAAAPYGPRVPQDHDQRSSVNGSGTPAVRTINSPSFQDPTADRCQGSWYSSSPSGAFVEQMPPGQKYVVAS